MIKFYISLTAFVFMALTGCSSHKKRLADRTHTDTLSVVKPSMTESSTSKNPYYNVNFQLDLFQKHIAFYGTNAVKNWELFIKNDSSFIFKLKGEKTVFEFSKGVQEAQGIRYSSKKVIETADTIQQKKITILLSEQNLEQTSINYLPFSVLITIEDQTKSIIYSGGGFYVNNPALHDIWVLDSLNNQKADTSQFSQGLPRLEFRLDGGKVSGFSGCNDISGTYYINQDEINFNPLITTMKFCIKTPGEKTFLEFLNKSRFEYRIANLQLTLQHRDKTRMIFKKAD